MAVDHNPPVSYPSRRYTRPWPAVFTNLVCSLVHLRLFSQASRTHWPALSKPASQQARKPATWGVGGGVHRIATVAEMSNAAATQDLKHLMRVIAATRTKTE